ncbi:MAG TPA: hypothetical protein VGQ17_12275 [Gemmatimonadales bacterium]|jgi:hypothetical protein|nr:hypothetical protein [Gemmatimonadales bacterium]
MYRSRSLQRAAAAISLLAAVACQESPNPVGPDTGPPAQNLQGPELPAAAVLDRGVAGFGGFFIARDGSPTVYLRRGANRAPAEHALEGYLRGRGLAASAVRVLEAKHSWKDLENWKDAATSVVLDIDGAVYVDNDETTNSVKIGVEDPGARGRVRAAIAQLGIPDDAVIVERAEPITQVATLQNVVDRPVRAGVQINFPGYLCSVGFNATSGTQKSFITASHCTNKQGGVEGTPYWQPLQSVDGTQIATEVADPVYVRGIAGCPKGRSCRYSDASRAAYIDGANQALGVIAATNGPNTGSLTITGSFNITGDDLNNSVAVGQTVNKVGRTTGWTSGTVSNTCVNTGVSGTKIVQLCQTFVSGDNTIVLGGDSGSGVWQSAGGTNATLVGILWGGNGSGTLFVYSPLKNVVQELGPLTTH